MDAAQLERLEALLLEGPEAHGFPTPLWSCPRVARLIGDEFGVRYHEGHVWKITSAGARSLARNEARRHNRGSAEEAIRGWQRQDLARAIGKRSPQSFERTIVFIRESGLTSEVRIVAAT